MLGDRPQHNDRDHDGEQDLGGLCQAIPILAACLSFVCCLWLLCSALPRLPKVVRQRSLMLRQLQHLASADLVMAIGGVAMLLPRFVYSVPRDSRHTLCFISYYGCWSCMLFGLVASTIFEVHLGISLALNAWRIPRISAKMKHVLPWLWLAALGLTLSDVFSNPARFHVKGEICKPLQTLRSAMVVTLVGLAMLANVAAYMTLLLAPQLQDSNAPDVTIRRAKQQVFRFCLITIVSWAPFWVGLALGEDMTFSWTGDLFGVVCASAIGLQGALNTWAYASQHRHIRQVWSRRHTTMQGSGLKDSFHPAFRVDVSIVETQQHSSKDSVRHEDSWSQLLTEVLVESGPSDESLMDSGTSGESSQSSAARAAGGALQAPTEPNV